MVSQILKYIDSLKIQKSKYLKNEALPFLQIEKFIHYTLRAAIRQKLFLYFLTEKTLKDFY